MAAPRQSFVPKPPANLSFHSKRSKKVNYACNFPPHFLSMWSYDWVIKFVREQVLTCMFPK